MRLKTLVALISMLALIPVSQAQEQEAQPAAKAKGLELLQQADARIAKAKTIRFKGSVRAVGALTTRSPHATGTVTLIRDAKAAPGFKFEARGESRWAGQEVARRPFATAFDGKIVRTVREREKQVVEASWAASTDLMDEGAGWLSAWILQWRDLITNRFNEPETILPFRVEGSAMVGMVECHVVYVDYSELASRELFDVWWFLSKEDGLPRRVDMHLVGAGGDGFTITEIEQLELDAPVEPAQIVLAVPEGFAVEKAKEPQAREGITIVKAAGPQASQAAPDWTLKDSDGKDVSLSDYRGKVVVMDFWATWCGPCRAIMPNLQKLHEKYKDKGVVVLGLNCWESADPVAFMKENGYTYGLILKADEVAKAYGVSAIPTLVVVGPDGKIRHRALGTGGEEAVERAINEALGASESR
jgi:thiol-disulfide isomerase/thioredoxin